MSLIKKIVEIVERNDNVDARKNIAKLNKDVKSYKEKVKLYIDSNYVDFIPCIINNESLIQEGAFIENELGNMKQNLDNEATNMYQANDEISKLVEELEMVNMKLNLSMKLVKIDKSLEKIKQYNENEDYEKINHILNNIQLIVNDPEDKIIRRLDMYENLKARLLHERVGMFMNLEIRFKNLVQMKEKSFLKTRSINMNITKNSSKLLDCTNALIACDFDFGETINFFMTRIFEPIISRAVSLEIAESDKDFFMNLSYSTEAITDNLRPSYSVVFNNIRQILSYLHNMNMKLNTGEFFLARIFEERRKDLLEMIFNDCLVHSIPKTFEEKNQCTMNEDIKKLSETFAELNFFGTLPGESLEDYSQKVDELFYEQFTKNIQESASELLKRDLHDMMLISEDTTLSTTTPMTFPRSMVSKSTLELVRMLEKIIKQAQNSADDKDKQRYLLIAIKTVLENFTFTVQLHHSKFMSKIPQHSALFYNNCMYLSNWVTVTRETEHCQGMEEVVDDLEKQGWEILELQIAKQKIQLLEILGEFDPSQSLNAVMPEHFKPIRQCLRQMELLKNVWQTILPSELYNKTMAGLLDVIAMDLVKKVVVMEDISTTLSNGLVDVIKNLDEKGQSLFENDTSVFNIVGSWQKMLHLQFVLDASLVDITNSWKAGQISQSFKVEEVKRLIRALFQNTDRRASALSAIA